ncbi:MAG: [FeFe] hydrogenase H-cluster radical SAM maturase HydE [Bacillota bacterium]
MEPVNFNDQNQVLNNLELILSSKDYDQDLFKAADKIRQKYHGDKVHLRGLIEFSNYCSRSCYYCGLRRENKKPERYRLSKGEIVSAALTAKELGYGTVVLQSGEDRYFTQEKITEIVKEIKAKTDLAITLSLGERTKKDYQVWREAGADRYLLRFETSDPELYQKLHPAGRFQDRIDNLYWLKESGYQLGSGSLIGLPGQTVQSLAGDLRLYKKLDLDMVGLGPFLMNPDTPLAGTENGSFELTLKMLALTRIILPKAHLPATTALGTINSKGREKALQKGANVMMPNVTPKEYRANYQLYPDKICTDESPVDCSHCIPARLKTIDRYPARGPGHSLK